MPSHDTVLRESWRLVALPPTAPRRESPYESIAELYGIEQLLFPFFDERSLAYSETYNVRVRVRSSIERRTSDRPSLPSPPSAVADHAPLPLWV